MTKTTQYIDCIFKYLLVCLEFFQRCFVDVRQGKAEGNAFPLSKIRIVPIPFPKVASPTQHLKVVEVVAPSLGSRRDVVNV